MPLPSSPAPTTRDRVLSLITGGVWGVAKGLPQQAREREARMQAAIEEEREQRRRNQAIMDEIGAYGGTPVMGPDGQMNPLATQAKALQLKMAMESARREADAKLQQRLSTEAKAREFGIDPEQAMQPTNAPGWSVLAKEPAKVQAKPLEQQVAQARIKAEADAARARAEATAPFENSFSQGDNYAKDGKPIGRAVRNLRTGAYGIAGADGTLQPIPEGAEPITATAIQKNLVGLMDFKKLKESLTDSERSLRQIERYAKSVGGLQQGLSGLADRFTAGIKTLLGSGKLTQEEVDRRIANGQLQGLLGGARLSVVGGGVMTEQDAQRIIDYLGGDVSAWQNKEQVMQALGQLYQDRFAQYENDINFYNSAVEEQYGAKGFKKSDYTDYNPLFGQPAVGGSASPAPASGLTPQEQARLNELRAKLGQ